MCPEQNPDLGPTFGMNWNFAFTPDLLTWYQCLISLRLLVAEETQIPTDIFQTPNCSGKPSQKIWAYYKNKMDWNLKTYMTVIVRCPQTFSHIVYLWPFSKWIQGSLDKANHLASAFPLENQVWQRTPRSPALRRVIKTHSSHLKVATSATTCGSAENSYYAITFNFICYTFL